LLNTLLRKTDIDKIQWATQIFSGVVSQRVLSPRTQSVGHSGFQVDRHPSTLARCIFLNNFASKTDIDKIQSATPFQSSYGGALL
jgi:hypothetical protein